LVIRSGSWIPASELVTGGVPTLRVPCLGQVDGGGHSSWLVIAGVCDLGGVSVPVACGVVDPGDGGGGVKQIGEDGGW
jgi:hypothetical protein